MARIASRARYQFKPFYCVMLSARGTRRTTVSNNVYSDRVARALEPACELAHTTSDHDVEFSGRFFWRRKPYRIRSRFRGLRLGFSYARNPSFFSEFWSQERDGAMQTMVEPANSCAASGAAYPLLRREHWKCRA